MRRQQWAKEKGVFSTAKGRTGVAGRRMVKMGWELGGSQGRRPLREGEAGRRRMSQIWKERGISR